MTKGNLKKLRGLISQFEDMHHDADWNDYMARNSAVKEVIEEHEMMSYTAEAELGRIANEIKKLNPSAYMIEKYNIDYILEWAY